MGIHQRIVLVMYVLHFRFCKIISCEIYLYEEETIVSRAHDTRNYTTVEKIS